MVLDFNKVVVLAENPLVFQGDPLRLLVIASHQIAGDLPRQTSGETDEPLTVAAQQLQIHPGPVVKPIDKPFGNQGNQVLIAGVVLTEEHQVVGGAVDPVDFVKPGAGRHIHLTADDGFDPHLSGRPVEINHAVHDAMVRDRHAVHAQLFCPRRQLLNLTGAV